MIRRPERPTRPLGASAALCLALALALPAPATAAPPDPAGRTAEADPLPSLVAGNGTAAPQLVTELSEAAASGSPAEAALAHLAAHPDRYHVDTAQLGELGTEHSADGRATVRFQQYHGGLPVLGGQYLVHLVGEGAGRRVEAVGGKYFTGLTAPTTAKAADGALRAAALGALPDPVARAAATADDLGAVVLPGGTGRLARRFVVRSPGPAAGSPPAREVYVDAVSGAVARTHETRSAPAPTPAAPAVAPTATGPTATTAVADAPPAPGGVPAVGTATDLRGRTVRVDIARMPDGTYRLVDLTRGGGIATYDAAGRTESDFWGPFPADLSPVTSATPDFPASAGAGGAVDAHLNAATVYDFYRDRFGRDGIDGKGGPIFSVVNTSDGGEPWPGAVWRSRMVYGNGDAAHLPFSADLDVTGHEMTHGVVGTSVPFMSGGQPGSINEALADYLGAAVDATANGIPMTDPRAALIGGGLCRTGTPEECARRRLDDRRTTVDDYLGIVSKLDGGGEHLNATIFGGALWDIRRTLDPLTADRLVYRTITSYLTPLDDFVDGRHAVLAAARSLGLGRAGLRTVAAAFDAHGIRAGWPDRIGTDSRALLRDTTAVERPAAAGGRWVLNIPDSNGDRGPLHTGSTTSPGSPVRLSPQDGRQHLGADTDGRSAAWLALPSDGAGPQEQAVLTRPLAGGPVRTVFTSTDFVDAVRVSGGDVAFLVSDPNAPVRRIRLSHDGAPAVELPLPEGHTVSGLALKDGRLGWIESWVDGDRTVDAPTVYSTATGQVTARYPADRPRNPGSSIPGAPGPGPAGRPQPFSHDPHFAGGTLVWVDRGASGAALRAGAADGSGVTDLVPAGAPVTPTGLQLAATDEAITFDHQAGPTDGHWSGGSVAKLYQVPVGGGTPVRVSCNRGEQVFPTADTGTRVVWLDGTRGRTDLVVRGRPAGAC
ncbi:M4 family metallopeptidase [Kitasatospora sp. NPDC056327]|uniref:M4 family metallopeptidase n=1 Tax=Kitasatospora sp. NPDC056327 TaxID=3345785 RepID=UPI0035D63046